MGNNQKEKKLWYDLFENPNVEDKGTSKESIDRYRERVEGMKIFANDFDKPIPELAIHKIILDHFNSPLPEGKTKKKAAIIGYDGFRADGIMNLLARGKNSVTENAKNGAVYHTYTGGVEGTLQATSTAPSWTSMVTGGWADYHGLFENGRDKAESAPSLFATLPRMGVKCSFNASWGQYRRYIFRAEIEDAEKNGLPFVCNKFKDDDGTFARSLADVNQEDGTEPDFVMFVLEYTDHGGHSKGFSNDVDFYVECCESADDCGMKILDTIRHRKTYEKEDWLIIVTTDHGGNGTSHGYQSIFERSTWMSVNKKLENIDELMNYRLTGKMENVEIEEE